MRNHRLVVLCLSLVVAGCECRPNVTTSVTGEVRWEWDTAAGSDSDSKARIDFPITTMGGRRDERLWVRNVGRVAFSMTEFAQLMGAPTSLNTQLAPQAAFEVRWQPDLVLNPTERTEVLVAFTPPITEGQSTVEYESFLELRPQGAAASPLTLTGKAIAGQCDVPESIDFGSVPLRSTLGHDISLRNDGAAPVKVVAGGVTGAPVGVFNLGGLDGNGTLTVAPGTAPNLAVTFTPSEPGDFTGQFTVRRADSCPQRTVTLKGRGVSSCLTWKAEPPDDPQGLGLHFGAVPPSSAGPGKVTFSNACSVPAELSNLHTSDPVFVVTAAAPQDVTLLLVPAATRDGAGTWVDGTAVTELEFRPMALGPKTGALQAATSLSSQPGVAVSLRGFGGGPRIEVRPSPLFAIGRVGFTPGAMPGTFVQRALRVANVGNRPTPADPRANLYLGPGGVGPTYFEVRAINGTDAELCVGEWDTFTDSCTNTLSQALYDPAVGIEASATGALQLPLRVLPATAGLKEWEITIYSNDVTNPEVRVRVTAEAIAAPPCNYSVTPTTLSYGILNSSQSRDLSFTLTNLGTTPSEICYFNGIGLSATTHPTFTLPFNPVDLTLNAGQSASVQVRAQAQTVPAAATQVTGAVDFNVSTPGAAQAAVLLDATLAPSCLTVSPAPLTFPDTQLECGSPERAVVISNTCASSVTLSSVQLTDPALAPAGSGTCATAGGCPQFAITSGPPAGAILPGASRTVLVRFRPYLTGAQTGALTVVTQQAAQTVPYDIPLVATGIPRTQATCGVQVSCPGPITVNANSTITLAPTSLTAPGAVSCAWSVASRPATSNGSFSAPTSCTSTTYFADVVGTHLISFNVSDAAGGTAQCQTPVTVVANGDLWIELTWDRNNDMDLHLLHPNAGSPNAVSSWFHNIWDCDFITDTPSWSANAQQNPSLDRDDITGRGPENIRINSPDPALNYAIGVHMYSHSAGVPVTSTVKLYCGGQLITTQTRTLSVVEDMWVVGSVRFMTGTVPCTFTPNGTVINVPP